MNATNPLEPTSTRSESGSWRPIDFFAIGIWLAIPIGVFAGRQPTLHLFEDYGVSLPIATQYVLHFDSPYVLSIASIVVILAILFVPHGGARRQFARLACIFGMLVGVICSLAILGPMWSLWRDLN